VAESKDVYISEVYKSVATNKFCLTIAVPIFEEGEFEGVLGVDFNIALMLKDFSHS